MITGEHAPDAGQALVGLDRDQRMDAIVRLQLITPPTLGRGASQSRATNRTNSHKWIRLISSGSCISHYLFHPPEQLRAFGRADGDVGFGIQCDLVTIELEGEYRVI